MSGNMKTPVAESDPRSGWFKLLIPEMEKVFGGLFWSDQVKFTPLPFVYGKLVPEQVAFDIELSIPYLAVDRVVLVEIVESKKDDDDAGVDAETQIEEQVETQIEEQIQTHFEIKVRPLKLVAMDQENRCFIPPRFVTCILPVDPRHPLVATLIAVTTDVVIPQFGEVGKIYDMKGREVDSSQLRE